MKKYFIALLSLTSALLLESCQKKAEGPVFALTGKRWMLEQVDGTSITVSSYSHDFNSFIQFSAQDNSFSGLATCSAIKGEFALAAAGQQLTLTQLTTTPGSCADLNVATKYLAALPQTKRYEIQANSLLLFDGVATGPRLVFRAAE